MNTDLLRKFQKQKKFVQNIMPFSDYRMAPFLVQTTHALSPQFPQFPHSPHLYILPLLSHFIKNNPAKWLEDRFSEKILKTEKICAKYYAFL